MPEKTEKIVKTDVEWRKRLTQEQYAVTRQQATKRPFTGEYVHNRADGTYGCVACGLPLFSSETKFESPRVLRWVDGLVPRSGSYPGLTNRR